MHKAWCNVEEVPYNFSRSSIRFQGHTGWKIDDLNPIWVRLLGQSQLSNPSVLPCFFYLKCLVLPTPLFVEPTKGLCYYNEVVGGYIGFTPSVRLSRLLCPLCNIYSSGWILSILATNDHYHERVCRTKWPLTLTYIFKVIGPSLRKSCPLCSVYSSWWILFIFNTNDHYY